MKTCRPLFLALSLAASVHVMAADPQYTTTEPYTFPVLPGTQAWANLNGPHEHALACEIPTAVAKSMTTEALIRTCMSYPLSGLLFAYHGSEQHKGAFFRNFYGFKELASRSDAASCLLEYYKEYCTGSNAKEIIDPGSVLLLHWLLDREEIQSLFTPVQKEQLASLSLRKFARLVKKSNDHGSAMPIVSLGLTLLVQKDVVIHKGGKTFDKRNLPDCAIRYIRGETIRKDEAGWVTTLADACSTLEH